MKSRKGHQQQELGKQGGLSSNQKLPSPNRHTQQFPTGDKSTEVPSPKSQIFHPFFLGDNYGVFQVVSMITCYCSATLNNFKFP